MGGSWSSKQKFEESCLKVDLRWSSKMLAVLGKAVEKIGAMWKFVIGRVFIAVKNQIDCYIGQHNKRIVCYCDVMTVTNAIQRPHYLGGPKSHYLMVIF